MTPEERRVARNRRRWLVATIVIVLIGWLWVRHVIVDSSPAPAEAAVPFDVKFRTTLTKVATTCTDSVQWDATHVRPFVALSQHYRGHAEPCLDLYRQTESDDSADQYVAMARVGWLTDTRDDSVWPFERAADDPGHMNVSLMFQGDTPVLDKNYGATTSARGDCASSVFEYAARIEAPWQAGSPSILLGSCDGDIDLTYLTDRGATWRVARPEQWDLTLTSYTFVVAEGVVPKLELQVVPTGASD